MPAPTVGVAQHHRHGGLFGGGALSGGIAGGAALQHQQKNLLAEGNLPRQLAEDVFLEIVAQAALPAPVFLGGFPAHRRGDVIAQLELHSLTERHALPTGCDDDARRAQLAATGLRGARLDWVALPGRAPVAANAGRLAALDQAVRQSCAGRLAAARP